MMSNKNMAKEWQKGLYQIQIDDNSVAIRTMRNGKVYECYADCHPDDEFNLSEGVKIAMERLEQAINPDVIKVGDKVKLVSPGSLYSCATQWILNNVTDIEHIMRWQYNNNHCDTTARYIVRYIAENEYIKRIIAYIENERTGQGYLFGVDSLEKINE